MLRQVVDGKDPFSFAILAGLTRIVLDNYLNIQIKGVENLPKSGPFICVANHSSRFDGPTIGRLINRPACFMVHPNELKGFQGFLLTKVGAFPSSPRYDFVAHVLSRFEKGEPFVIFPEGTVHYDGITHPFKKGVTKVAFAALEAGFDVPIIPIAAGYDFQGKRKALYNIGEAIAVSSYKESYARDAQAASQALLDDLHKQVLALRMELGFEIGERLIDAGVLGSMQALSLTRKAS